jgi:hypothetical protein
MNETDTWYELDGQQNPINPQSRPSQYGLESPDSRLNEDGYYRLWVQDAGPRPGNFYDRVAPHPTFNATKSRVERVDSWQDMDANDKRLAILDDGKNQIPDWTPGELLKVPARETEMATAVGRWQTMKIALAATDDADLDTFDTNLDSYAPDPAIADQHLINSGGDDGWAVGSIQMSILATPPGPLWRLADGSDCTGTAYATATGNNTLPDLRGAYLRMAGQNGSNSAWDGGTLGGWQEDRTALPNTAFTTHTAGNHYHSLGWYENEDNDMLQQYYNNTASAPSALAQHMRKMEDPASGGNSAEGDEREMATSTDGAHTHTITGGDAETRPKTYSVNYFIKVD